MTWKEVGENPSILTNKINGMRVTSAELMNKVDKMMESVESIEAVVNDPVEFHLVCFGLKVLKEKGDPTMPFVETVLNLQTIRYALENEGEENVKTVLQIMQGAITGEGIMACKQSKN